MIELLLHPALLVTALGYFVDTFDLLIFNMVRVESLRSLGFQGRELEVGAILSNYQMTGLVLGGIFWGVCADKKGRRSVLFASIILYSLGNFLCGFVQTIEQYEALRFIAGFGLAGELGVGITFVAELMPTSKRGYGTLIVATVGGLGAITAGLVSQWVNWRTAYQFGGALGLLLLLLRVGINESGVFVESLHTQTSISRGAFFQLFTRWDRFKRFLYCILIGVPTWYATGVLISNSPEIAKAAGVSAVVINAKAFMFYEIGFTSGDLWTGLLSQFFKSRKKVVLFFITFNALMTGAYLFVPAGSSDLYFYGICLALGLSAGYWALVVTIPAEQFGTNLRATVATSVPNFMRFALVPMNFVLLALKPGCGLIQSVVWIGAVVLGLAFFAATQLKESFHQDLRYLE